MKVSCDVGLSFRRVATITEKSVSEVAEYPSHQRDALLRNIIQNRGKQYH